MAVQSLEESGYTSSEEEEPKSGAIKVPCENCSELVKELKVEINALKKRQLPGRCFPENQITTDLQISNPIRINRYKIWYPTNRPTQSVVLELIPLRTMLS